MPRQPLFPHIPKSRKKANTSETDLRLLPDSPEVLAQTIRATGFRDRLATVFQEAIARAKGKRLW